MQHFFFVYYTSTRVVLALYVCGTFYPCAIPTIPGALLVKKAQWYSTLDLAMVDIRNGKRQQIQRVYFHYIPLNSMILSTCLSDYIMPLQCLRLM